MYPEARSERARGFILVAVLWTIALIAAVGIALGAGARTEARIARNLVDAQIAEAAIDGAVAEASFRLQIEGPGRWRADGAERLLVIGGVRVMVRVEDERGKVNPNLAPAALLAALLEQAGAGQAAAAALAREIVDWRGGEGADVVAAVARYGQAGRPYRPPGQPFRDIDELGLVLGIDPILLARLRPWLSLAQPGSPDPALAPDRVRRALAIAPWNAPSPPSRRGPAFSILARTEAPAAASRRAVVLLGCADGAAGCATPVFWSREPN